MLSDPRLLNYAMIALSTLAALRWLIAGELNDTLYWSAAAVLNSAITFGHMH